MELVLRDPEQRPARSRNWRDALRDCEGRSWELIRGLGAQRRHHLSDRTTYILDDATRWLNSIPDASLHAIVTDPPYGVLEYEEKDHEKLRAGRGGVWRIPPSFDGAKRRPLPRFTVLSREDLAKLQGFFGTLADSALRALVPGGHLFIASNPLLSSLTFHALQNAGFEKRGEIIRLVQTLRGGYKPKGAEQDFPDVSVMPRSCWEPWGIFRKPIEGTVAENLRRWGAGGLRRLPGGGATQGCDCVRADARPRKGYCPAPVAKAAAVRAADRSGIAAFGIGIIYDPFAGSASTLAAAEALGYRAIGTDRDEQYLQMGQRAFAALVALSCSARVSDRELSPSRRVSGITQ